MYLMKFINENKNWQEILQAPPYCIEIKQSGAYALLKYNQFASDFSNPIVKECRGLIVYMAEDSSVLPVCVPFYKFHNWGEEFADEIDWTSAVVMEKIDGSIMKAWYHLGWHLSTNGGIDAFSTFIDGTNTSFGDLFVKCVGDFNSFCSTLDPGFTYMFELTTSQNRVVVRYDEDAVWYLGRRNNYTFIEDIVQNGLRNVKFPKIFDLSSLDACIEAACALENNAEGFVVRDANWHRVKVKNPAWVAASHLHNNGNITPKTIVNMWFEGKIDDYVGTFPDDKEKVMEYVKQIEDYIEELNSLWNYDITLQDIINSESPHKDYLFGRIRGKWFTGLEYVKKMNVARLLKALGYD